jgi:hypothetical protein
MRRLATCLLLLLVGCGDKRRIYTIPRVWQGSKTRQLVEEYPDSPYANQAKTRLVELEKARLQGAWSLGPLTLGILFLRGGFQLKNWLSKL